MKKVKMDSKYESEIKEVTDIAFELQPNSFTSNQLGLTVRELLSDNPVVFEILDTKMKQGYLANYLANRRDELERITYKRFNKIKPKQKESIISLSEIDKAINMLKNAGYKVFKPTITFDEI